jgi:hypothetical protein
MKSLRFIITAIVAVTSGVFTFAQTPNPSQTAQLKTETFSVSGMCDMCKTRIEKAAKTSGVSTAEWKKDTKVLTLVYNPSVVTSETVQKKIAAVGHDTGKFRADDKVYNSLPGCCKYERESKL